MIFKKKINTYYNLKPYKNVTYQKNITVKTHAPFYNFSYFFLEHIG